MDFSILFAGENMTSIQLLPKFQIGHMSSIKLAENVQFQNDQVHQMVEEFFHPVACFVAIAVAVCHPITQVNIAHIGCIVFNDQTSQLSHLP
jgi:hypothetical protein